ncbi:MAG: LpxI family protein [Alphaproteobacteria bacterium]|nr:LpxI family protein [Alphaproteobacteria bacterium]
MARILALFAGQGDLPSKIIHECHAKGLPLFLIAFEGQTDPDLIDQNQSLILGHIWIHFGAIGKMLNYMKTNKVTHIIMAGSMRRPAWSELKPDWKAAQWLTRISLTKLAGAKLAISAAGDDGLLKTIMTFLREEGFEFMSSADILDNLLAPEGVMGMYEPNETDWQNITRGKEVIHLLGAGDIGQAVVVQEDLVLGVEAIEGTEGLLSRCGLLRREGRGGVLIKMAKPNQSRMADLPTIGVATIHQAQAAGLSGIAIEAGSTQILDQNAVIAAADKAGLFLIGVTYS